MSRIEEGFRWLFGAESMRYRPEWMTGSDDRILEFLADTDAGHNLRGIENNFKDQGETLSYTTLKRRIPVLKEAGLVREIAGEGSYYAITDKGRSYLDEDLDLRGEPEPQP